MALVLTALAALSGCESMAVPRSVVAPESFAGRLAAEYLVLADAEAARYDHRDAAAFRARAYANLRGETVLPEAIDARVLPAAERPVLLAASERLRRALDRGARILAPGDAAVAQAMFDCWMEEQEEGHQPDDIAFCRDGFTKAMDAVDGALGRSLVVLLPDHEGRVGSVTVSGAGGSQRLTEALAASTVAADAPPGTPGRLDDAGVQALFGDALRAEPSPPARFLLYFDAGTDRLTAESQAQLPAIKAAADGRPAPDLSVIGHADRQGAASVNERLARLRAEAVAGLLAAIGIPAEAAVSIDSFGEADPVVATADGVAEPLNRRVEVTVR